MLYINAGLRVEKIINIFDLHKRNLISFWTKTSEPNKEFAILHLLQFDVYKIFIIFIVILIKLQDIKRLILWSETMKKSYEIINWLWLVSKEKDEQKRIRRQHFKEPVRGPA